MWEAKARCFLDLKILKCQFLIYQCRVFLSDCIMDGEGKTLLTMPVCKISTRQGENPKNIA